MASQKLIKKIYCSQYSYNNKLSGAFGERYITYADYIASAQPLKFIEKSIELFPRTGLISTHQSRITDYIGSQYRRKPSLDAFFGHEAITLEYLWEKS